MPGPDTETDDKIITYAELQNRIDYLQNIDYALWNAFYPTRFVKAGVQDNITQQNKLLDNFLANPSPSIEKVLTLEKEAKIGSNILGNDDGVLAVLESVSSNILKFMNVPYTSKGGVLTNSISLTPGGDNPFVKDDRTVKLKFKVDGKFNIYKSLLDWKENWASSNLEHRYLKTRKSENTNSVKEVVAGENKELEAIAEGYLGLSYVNVKYDGSIETNAHLALFGLIPIKINFAQTIGPGAGTNNKPTVECTCTVASGLFIIKDDKRTKVYPLA